MKLFLPQKKVEEIVQMSHNAMESSLTLRDLTKSQWKLTFNRNLRKNLGLPHSRINTFDSQIYTQSKQSSSLAILKLPEQQQMETLPNYFQKNFKSFKATII